MSDDVEQLYMVLYSDGGYRASTGCAGSGVHGYTTTGEIATSGNGAKYTIGHDGYLTCKDKDKEIKVIEYVDAWMGIEPPSTNNVAELKAMIMAMKLVLEKNEQTPVVNAFIYTDSEYVVKGINESLSKWSTNGYVRSNSTESIRNVDLWKEIKGLKDTLDSKDIAVKIAWVKGHSVDLGNYYSDINATRGMMSAEKGNIVDHCEFTPAKGYWSKKVDFNRLLSKPVYYFNTHTTKTFDETRGYHIYHIGRHGKDDNMAGKPISDASYSIAYLKEPDTVLDSVKGYYESALPEGDIRLVTAKLGTLQQSLYRNDIETYGYNHLHIRNLTDGEMYSPDDTLIAKIRNPPGLAYKLTECLTRIQMVLDSYLGITSTFNVVSTDITDEVFVTETSDKGKVKVKLSDDIKTSTKFIKPRIKFDTRLDSKDKNGRTGDYKIKYCFDLDLPSRNALSALASEDIKIYAITWRESSTMFNYASIVETKDGVAIYAASYSNQFVLK